MPLSSTSIRIQPRASSSVRMKISGATVSRGNFNALRNQVLQKLEHLHFVSTHVVEGLRNVHAPSRRFDLPGELKPAELRHYRARSTSTS